MKKILWIVLILFGYIGVFAQEKTIEQAEFDAVYQNSFEKLKGKSHRIIMTTQSSVEGRPQTDFSSKTVLEFASPTTSRTTYESSFQSVNKKTETIRIGGKTYTRKESDVWKEENPKVKSQPGNKLTRVDNEVDNQIEYKFLGSEKLNNQSVNRYAKIAGKKLVNSANNKETLSITTTKYWFNEDGMLLKSDMEMESRTREMVFHTRLTQIWELDPNIKIIAPTLDPTK